MFVDTPYLSEIEESSVGLNYDFERVPSLFNQFEP